MIYGVAFLLHSGSGICFGVRRHRGPPQLRNLTFSSSPSSLACLDEHGKCLYLWLRSEFFPFLRFLLFNSMRFLVDSNAPSSSRRLFTCSLAFDVNRPALLQIKRPFNSTLQPRNKSDLANLQDLVSDIELWKKRIHDSPVVPTDSLGHSKIWVLQVEHVQCIVWYPNNYILPIPSVDPCYSSMLLYREHTQLGHSLIETMSIQDGNSCKHRKVCVFVSFKIEKLTLSNGASRAH